MDAPSTTDLLDCAATLSATPFVEETVHASGLLRAARLLCQANGPLAPVCTQDRIVIAAAVLAALASAHAVTLAPDATPDRCLETDGLLADLIGVLPKRDEAGAIELEPVVGPADRTAVVLLTGGSTGRPKAIEKSVGNLLGEAFLWRQIFVLQAPDVVLATVSPLHIYGLIHSVLAPLLSGCTLVRETAFLPAEIERLARRRSATVLVSSPPHLRLLSRNDVHLPALRLVLSSGSLLPEETADAVQRRLGVPVVEIYGSTETGAIATRCRARGEQYFTPLPQVETRVVNELLYVRSPYVSPGLPQADGGWTPVGDRVDPTGDSSFVLLGRVDDVVKIAGKRIDLQELETHLRTAPEVDDVALYSERSERARQVELGVVVVLRDPKVDAERLVKRLLSSTVRPRWIRQVNQIPRTATGKTDRAAIGALLKAPPQCTRR